MDLLKAKKTAKEVIEKYNKDGLSPFPYETIVQDKKDVDIVFTDKLPNGVSGAISFFEEKEIFVISIDNNDPSVRKNFTIAHELGHYFLHQKEIKEEGIIIDSDRSMGDKSLFMAEHKINNVIETEANNFAAELIMPEETVKEAWENLKDVGKCANVFSVSITSMSIRLDSLNLIKYS